MAPDKHRIGNGLDDCRRFVEARDVDGLASLLQSHPSADVRALAARRLKEFQHARSVEALGLAATTDIDKRVRAASLRAVAHLNGTEAMPILVDQLKRGEKSLRRTASSLISDFEPPVTREALQEALDDSDWYVRFMAATGLGKSSDREVRMALLEPRRSERNPLVWVTLWRATRVLK
jgi:HEAT repeat protein